jgi:NADPH:quinone reductase-like Zn-dependent oxidoreductase
MSLQQLAVLPYSFTTMWLAVKSTGLTDGNARGKRVLIHGAAGALGRLALQWLNHWGCELTAICGTAHAQACRELGAHHTVERGPQALQGLPSNFDVVLNFANWDDELTLAARLAPNALGQATTVHPLLGHVDQLGWVSGAIASRRDFRAAQRVARARAPDGRYSWTLFKPIPQALDALAQRVQAQPAALPVGLCVDLDHASAAFAHMASGQPGRAVLLP